MSESEIKQQYNKLLKRFHGAEKYFNENPHNPKAWEYEAEFSKICRRLGELACMLGNKLTEDEWFNGFKEVNGCSN